MAASRASRARSASSAAPPCVGATLQVGRHRIAVTNLQKPLYPATGFTKGDLIDYYIRIAPVLLPHLRDHPLTLKRYPNGVEQEFFYEKQAPAHRPDWVKTVPVPSTTRGRPIDFVLANDVSTLVWLGNLADLELHPGLPRARALDRPTWMVFDLDPGPGTDLRTCCRVALLLREKLTQLKLTACAKTSGSKGMQLYVPLHTRVTFDETKEVARQLGDLIAGEHPRLVTTVMRKTEREGRVFIDWSQNDDHKTTVSVYSLRATPEPSVSTPLRWEEVERGARARSLRALRFSPAQVLERVQEHGDLFAPVLTLKQKLPS